MKKLLFSSPILDASGYAEAGRLYLKSLTSIGIEPLLHTPTYDNKKRVSYQDLPENLEQMKYAKGDQFDVFLNHITPDISFTQAGVPSYCYTVWETSHIPKSAVPKCNQFEKIFTASEYSKSSFLNGGVTSPIEVLPHPIIKKKFKRNKELAKKFEGKFVFFSNFEWHIGKGYDVLIKAFSNAFQGNKDVVLIMKTYSMDVAGKYSKHDEVKKLKGNSEYPSIVVIDNIISEDNLFTLYDICDVYVSLSRREAFSLTSAEAVSFGKKVVAPDKGGQIEFLKDYSGFISVESEMKDVPDSVELSRSIYRGQQWVEPDLEDAIDALRYSFNFYPKLNYQEVLSNFTLEKIGNQLAKGLKCL